MNIGVNSDKHSHGKPDMQWHFKSDTQWHYPPVGRSINPRLQGYAPVVERNSGVVWPADVLSIDKLGLIVSAAA